MPFDGIAGLPEAEVRELARETGFEQRAPRKIGPVVFAGALCELSVAGTCSFNDLAARIDEAEGGLVSRQAVAKRMGGPCVDFMQAILNRVLARRCTAGAKAEAEQIRYGRVLVQDSTVIRLPIRLFGEFSGVSNGSSTVCSARIQTVYDLVEGAFVRFSIDPYSRNDLAVAPELELRAGDLTLRDRGYLLAAEIQRHLDVGADCIYRHKFGTIYLDPETGEPIDLPGILRQRGAIDMDVCLNNPGRTPVRLVAAPADEETANRRRSRAKRDAKGHAPSKDLLDLMSWTIFLTTIPRERASFRQILDTYGLRWRIETVFKAWKSELRMHRIHNVSANQLRALLIARMIVLAAGMRDVFHRAREAVLKLCQKDLSMIKTFRFIAAGRMTIAEFGQALSQGPRLNSQLERLARYCTYDRRRRENFNEKCDRWIDELALG